MVGLPLLAGLGTAHPPLVSQDELWSGFFADHYRGVGRGLAQRIFQNAGVATRHAAVNPLVEDVSGWSTGARMRRYPVDALPLARAALATALDQAAVESVDIGLLVVCSCTGYATPGLDISLAQQLGMSPAARRLLVGHMGCYAALPGLGAASDYVTCHNQPAAVVCVELASLHVQPPTVDPQQVVAHALFSDAAAAVVLRPAMSPAAGTAMSPAAGTTMGMGADHRGPYRLAKVVSRTEPDSAEHMTWDVTDLGFRMGLSAQVPQLLARGVGELVRPLLRSHGLAVHDVAWAVHPGGPRILEVVEAEFALGPDGLEPSRSGLREHGNCSSPTVLLILDRLLRTDGNRKPVVLLAFGPGLTLYAALLTIT